MTPPPFGWRIMILYHIKRQEARGKREEVRGKR